MSRNISTPVLSSMMAQESDQGYVILLKIDHTDISPAIYLSSTDENFTSNGQLYLGCPFKIDMPGTNDRVTMTVDNVDRNIVLGVRSVTPGTTPPSVDMSIVTLDTPNTVEAGPFNLSLKDARWNKLVVTGRLAYEDIQNEPYPYRRFTPSDYSGLF